MSGFQNSSVGVGVSLVLVVALLVGGAWVLFGTPSEDGPPSPDEPESRTTTDPRADADEPRRLDAREEGETETDTRPAPAEDEDEVAPPPPTTTEEEPDTPSAEPDDDDDEEDAQRGTSGLRGRVLFVDESPVSGVEVTVTGFQTGGGHERMSTETDEQGAFLFEGLLGGEQVNYIIRAHPYADGYLSPTARARITTLGEIHDLGVLRMLREAAVHGVVVNPENEPVAGAQVRARVGSGLRAVNTDENGEFRLGNLRAEEFTLQARHVDYLESESQPLHLAHGEVHGPITLALRDALSLEVTVLNMQEDPVAGAQVVLHESAGFRSDPVPRANTDRNGVALLDGIDFANGMLNVFATDYLPLRMPINFDEQGRPFEVEVVLIDGAGLTGRIVEATGEPVAGELVRISPAAPSGGGGGTTAGAAGAFGAAGNADAISGGRVPSPPRTDEDGRFELRGQEPVPVWLHVREERFGPFPLRAGHVFDAGTLVLAGKGTIEVHIRDPQGEPVSTHVYLRRVPSHIGVHGHISSGDHTERARTNAEGTASIEVATGSYTVRSPGRPMGHPFATYQWPDLVTVEPGATVRLEIHLSDGGRVAGRVRDDTGEPLQRTLVKLISDSHGYVFTSTGDNGTFEFAQVHPGRYRIAVSNFELKDGSEMSWFELNEGQSVERELVVRRIAATLTLGLVLHDQPGGTMIGGATVQIVRQGAHPRVPPLTESTTGADGFTQALHVPSNTALFARVQVPNDLGLDEEQWTFRLGTLQPGTTVQRRLDFYPPERVTEHESMLTGRIARVGDNLALASATVSVQRVGQDGGHFIQKDTRTDHNGRYRIDGLNPGQYQVTVTAPGYAQERTTVTLGAGDSHELNLALYEAGSLHFDISVADPSPEIRISITVRIQGEPESERTRVAPVGRIISFDGLRLGELYEFEITAKRHHPYSNTVTVRPGDATPIPLRLTSAN